MDKGVPKEDNPSEYCPDKVECTKLGTSCILCDFNYKCIYGKEYNTTCRPKVGVICTVSLLTNFYQSYDYTTTMTGVQMKFR